MFNQMKHFRQTFFRSSSSSSSVFDNNNAYRFNRSCGWFSVKAVILYHQLFMLWRDTCKTNVIHDFRIDTLPNEMKLLSLSHMFISWTTSLSICKPSPSLFILMKNNALTVDFPYRLLRNKKSGCAIRVIENQYLNFLHVIQM